MPLLLAACAGSLFKTKALPPNLYVLSAEPQPLAATAVLMQVDLAVMKPTVRAGLDTDRIAVLYKDRRLDYFASARWSGPLDEIIQELAVQVFHARTNLHNVSADTSAFPSAYWLESK